MLPGISVRVGRWPSASSCAATFPALPCGRRSASAACKISPRMCWPSRAPACSGARSSTRRAATRAASSTSSTRSRPAAAARRKTSSPSSTVAGRTASIRYLPSSPIECIAAASERRQRDAFPLERHLLRWRGAKLARKAMTVLDGGGDGAGDEAIADAGDRLNAGGGQCSGIGRDLVIERVVRHAQRGQHDGADCDHSRALGEGADQLRLAVADGGGAVRDDDVDAGLDKSGLDVGLLLATDGPFGDEGGGRD